MVQVVPGNSARRSRDVPEGELRVKTPAETGHETAREIWDFHLLLWKWVFPKIGVPQNGWFIMETPIIMNDLGVPLFLETPKWSVLDSSCS